MSWLPQICDKIIEKKSIIISEDNEIQTLIDNIERIRVFLEKSQDFEKEFQCFINKSIIIKLISIFEGFFKIYIKNLIMEGDLSFEKVVSKIDKKIKMSELLYFQDKNIQICDLVTELFNFQDLRDIDTVFRNLLDLKESVFDLLKKFYIRNLKLGVKRVENIYTKLQEIIKLRHNIVHNFFFEFNLEQNIILEYISFIVDIIVAFADLIAENLLVKKNVSGMAYLGFLRWALNDYDAAIKCFEECLKIESDFPVYLMTLGCLYSDKTNYGKSIKYFHSFLEKEPNDYIVWNLLGEALNSDKQYQDSLKAFQEALKYKPDDLESLQGMILNYSCLKEYEKGLNIVKKALEIDKENKKTYWLSGCINYEVKNYNDALKAFNKCLEIKQDDNCFLCYTGRTLIELKKFDDAIIILEKATSLESIEVCSFKYLALAYQRKGDLTKALSILENAIKLAEEDNDKDEISKIRKMKKRIEKDELF